MEFEQWKLLRQSEEETGLKTFYEELGSVNKFFAIVLVVSVFISVAAVLILSYKG
jgi:hypothetical protein